MKDLTPSMAITRHLPSSFSECLKQNSPSSPIEFELAQAQHSRYMEAVQSSVHSKIEQLSSDLNSPDCSFIEDTVVCVSSSGGAPLSQCHVLVTRSGAPSRRKEKTEVIRFLKSLSPRPIISEMQSPACLDGGDVLDTGEHLLVGLSERTNAEGIENLSAFFAPCRKTIPLPVNGPLHLKSIISLFDPQTLLIADTPAGKSMAESLQEKLKPLPFELVWLPDPIAANVLNLGSTVLIQDGFPRSQIILELLARKKKKKIVRLQMSELIKADGALTCGSVLIYSPFQRSETL